MALTVDGIRIPAHVQAQGNDATEAYVRDLKARVGIPHPAPPLETGEGAPPRAAQLAARAEQWAPKLAQIAELQAKEQAEAEATVTAKPRENPPPVARAQHRAQATPKPAEPPAAPAAETPAK